MAVSVVETATGSASSAESVTVTFSDAVEGDLILFIYATYFKEFGESDWLANSGWDQIPSAIFTAINGFSGMCFHIVGSGETSWNPVNDSSNSVAGLWIAKRIQGHSTANPILNYYIAGGGHGSTTDMYPNTVPCADHSGELGMMFGAVMLAAGTSTTVSGGVEGGDSWTSTVLADGSSNHLVAVNVAAIDNITPATGGWTNGTAPIQYLTQWVVQPAPTGPSDTSHIVKQEVITSDFSGLGSSSDIGFKLSWTPTVGNYLLALFAGSTTFPNGSLTVQPNWTIEELPLDGGLIVALRTVQMGDGTSYTVSTTGGTPSSWTAYVYEITGAAYSGTGFGTTTSPNYTTPEQGGVGETLCFFMPVVATNEENCWPQYSILSGQTPDGSSTWSRNDAGINDKFTSAASHLITTAGGQASTGLASTTADGIGVTVVFDIVGSACVLPTTLNFTGDVSGLFYKIETMGSEVVPINFADSTVTIDNGTMSPTGQAITSDNQWVLWHPNSGPLSIDLGTPVRTLWVVTSKAKASPPSIPVWASSQIFPLWKQTCTVE